MASKFTPEALRRIAERKKLRCLTSEFTAALRKEMRKAARDRAIARMKEELERPKKSEPFRLWMLTGEATALAACMPGNRYLLNAACIVRGYVEAFPFYRGDNPFPWEHVQAIVERMRAGVKSGHFGQWHVSGRPRPEGESV